MLIVVASLSLIEVSFLAEISVYVGSLSFNALQSKVLECSIFKKQLEFLLA